MLVNKYGFDFDGNTSISGYTNPDLTLNNMKVKTAFLYKESATGEDQWLFYGARNLGYSGVNMQLTNKNRVRISIFIQNTGLYSIETTEDFLSFGEYYEVECSYKKNINDNNITISLIVNDVIIDTLVVNPSTRDIKLFQDTPGYYPISGSNASNRRVFSIVEYIKFETNNIEVYSEDFSTLSTKGTVIGTEQYALIFSTYEPRITAKKTKTYDITNKDYIIDYNYFYGGDFSIECDGLGEKTFTIGFWNEAQQGFTFAGKQTITGNIAQFSYSETATRRMKIGISSEQPLTELTLTQEKLFDVLVDSNVVGSGATTQDRFVNYNQVLNNSRTLTVRVKNEDYNFAQTLFKNKVYLDGEEWQISSPNVDRLGLSHRKFNMSLQRLL